MPLRLNIDNHVHEHTHEHEHTLKLFFLLFKALAQVNYRWIFASQHHHRVPIFNIGIFINIYICILDELMIYFAWETPKV